jgi:hypothetical protein
MFTLATFFCLPCEPHSPYQIRKNKVVCNEYGGRSYLRPIMPPMTRRQSQRQSRKEGMDRWRVGDGGERFVEGTDSVWAEAEENLMDKPHKMQDIIALAPQASSDETRASEDIGTNDAPTKPSSSPQDLKSRTFLTEMTDALEALHRKEEEEVVQGTQIPLIRSNSNSKILIALRIRRIRKLNLRLRHRSTSNQKRD